MAAAPTIGTILDTYELQALLGKGGMALVYRGFDHNLQRPVAVKILTDTVAGQPGFTDRFRQEARLIASLHHPHIVQVYDFGEQDGHTYMVQELLAGPTLEQHLSRIKAQGQRLTQPDIVTILTQLASALDAAHAAGIIHRDVKPSNAMWNSSGNIVLTDFGIAKSLFTSARHTQTGAVIGTPYYLSPEQAQGLPLTSASDIYALGVVAYELIANKVPFASNTPMSVVMDHIQTPAPPLKHERPDVDSVVEAVVLRALNKDPDSRFASADEFTQALVQAWAAAPAVAPPPLALAPNNQPTSLWGGAAARVASPPAVPQPGAVTPQAAAAPARARRPFILLPLLGGLLLLLFLCGTLMAVFGSRNVDANTAPTDVPALIGATDIPATTIVETATAELPIATQELPTAAPQPPVPPPEPTAEPPPEPPPEPQDEPADNHQGKDSENGQHHNEDQRRGGDDDDDDDDEGEWDDDDDEGDDDDDD